MMNSLLRCAFTFASWRPGGAALSILAFHRVHAEPDPLFPGELDAERFDALCAVLAATCRVLSLEHAVELLAQGRLPTRAVCITFDDGYADNHAVALPILSKHGLCASFFVTTGFIDGGCMWNDCVVEAVRRSELEALDLRDWGLGVHALKTVEQRRAAIAALLPQLKYLPHEERSERCRALMERAGVQAPRDLMMDWDQVRDLHRQGMQLGAHTVDHPILARLAPEAARRQIQDSCERLGSELQAPVRLFAYPNGRWGDDVSPETAEMLRKQGLSAAVTTEPGYSVKGTDTMLLRRFTPWDQNPRRFVLRLMTNLFKSPAALI